MNIHDKTKDNSNWRIKLRQGIMCIFCNTPCKSNDSFKHVDVQTNEEDTFHLICFRGAIRNMIRKVKDESKNGKTNRSKK